MKDYPLSIALIEEDEDDQFIFSSIIESTSIPAAISFLECKKDIQTNLSTLESLFPDIIFLGCPLKHIAETEYLEKIRDNAILKETFCVIISGYTHNKYLKGVFNAGANLHINKFNDIAVLKNIIIKVLKLDLKNCPPPTYETFHVTEN
ncbi:response regulator [Emticicia sp. C21]|uniref:response regulator n=1 Tax=Emticicia sp. C21 TaxID=2302915 RepID=UPI000E34AFA7|nr:response regulator [Emticicia sp. C21]RFS18585.1 response regulator [Emticicia sp. C21]